MRSLLGEAWVGGSAALVIIGLVAASVPLVGLGMLVAATGGLARLWARLSLEEVRYERELSERRVFVGEEIELRIRLANGKALPVPWLEVQELLPEALPVTGGHTTPSGRAGLVMLNRTTALARHERLEWKLSLKAERRGFYRIGPTRLRSGDLFGLFDREAAVGRSDGLVVYPRTYSLPDLGIGGARPFGDERGGQRIFEDPVRVMGVRDYVPGDPLKRIDWSATARAGRVQSRLYEPSRTRAVIVALNITTMERSWHGADPVLLERSVVVAASIAQWAFEAGSSLGLIANGAFPNADRPIRIGAGRRPDQLARVLEALGMVGPLTTSSLADELRRRRNALPAGATLVVVAARMPSELAATLQRLREEGHAVHVVKTAEAPWEERLVGVPVSEVATVLARLEAGEAEIATVAREATASPPQAVTMSNSGNSGNANNEWARP